MRKKVLFIVSNMETGGVSKSMISLLNTIDTSLYNVSLLLISPTGELMTLLPKNINVITNPILAALTSRVDGFIQLIKLGKPLLALGHVIRLILSLIDKSLAGRFLAYLMPAIKEEYDAIIDYNGQQQLYYMVNKLNTKKKITFFHSDYKKWPYYYNADKKYFPKVDAIFTISEICVDSLKQYFPECSDKIHLMENISSPALINKMAQEQVNIPQHTGVLLATIGHICYNKGIDIAIKATKTLQEKGIDFKWIFIGAIVDKKYFDIVKENRLNDNMLFLGTKSNPYPYLNAADIIVHPSRFEGRSIALDEAKILCKPIVATNFSTVNDQFTDRVNASICEMAGESVANSILELIENKNLREKYINYLKSNISDNSSEIQKLYSLIERNDK